MKRARGFTLIEVMVALFVIALGVGVLLTTLAGSADAVRHLREKSFAQWIALNRLAELRLSGSRIPTGTSSDTVEYAGQMWRYQQQVSNAGLGNLLRVDVRVAPVQQGSGQDSEEFAALGSAVGFLGSTPMRASGLTPDWGLRAPTGPGADGEGDGRDRGRDRTPDDGAPPPADEGNPDPGEP